MSVGQNSQVAPSAVPPLFLWHDNATGTEVVALFHALGYGGSWPAESEDVEHWRNEAQQPALPQHEDFYVDALGTTVMRAETNPYDDGPGLHVDALSGRVHGNASRSEACVSFAPAGVALCYAWRVDNSGPHPHWESTLIFDAVRGLFPEASEVIASDAFDDFVDDVWPLRHLLPVVQQEIGDSWIMGANADPLKIALTRAASRIHSQCVRQGDCAEPNPTAVNGDATSLRAFERLLMLANEHTWGWNGGHVRSKS